MVFAKLTSTLGIRDLALHRNVHGIDNWCMLLKYANMLNNLYLVISNGIPIGD